MSRRSLGLRVLFTFALALILAGCGGGDDVPPPAPPAPPGTPDASFGSAGQVATEIPGHDAYPNAVALQVDGKIVVAGVVADAARESILLVRYDADGGLDPTFGTGGK